MTGPPAFPPPHPAEPPNPWQYSGSAIPPRPSWTMPLIVGALATVLLHSPLLSWPSFWCLACFGCSGVPVGLVPALLQSRRAPGMGAASGFALSFLSVGLGAAAIAAATLATGFELDPQMQADMTERLRAQGKLTEDEVQQMVEFAKTAAPFVPMIAAVLIALGGGVCGAVVGALSRRQPPQPLPGWWPAQPGQAPPG